MDNKFKQGDWVRVRHLLAKNQISRITRVEENGYWVSNTFWVGNIFCTERNLEPIDPSTAFLTELQNLLRKWNAVICGSPTENAFILIGENKIKYSDSWIGSDNIFDYEK